MTAQLFTSLFADGAMGQTQSMSDEQKARRLNFYDRKIEALSPVMLTSAHGNEIALVTEDDAGTVIENIDGFVPTAHACRLW